VKDPSQWTRVEAALDEILELPETQWPQACERLAGGDPLLLAEITSLLARIGGEDPVLDRPLALHEVPSGTTAGLAAGTRVGAYRVVALIGRGGMGEVYWAERADGQYQQRVALKLIRSGSTDDPERFRVERQILAQLEHPGIARLLDGGVTDDGLPYMVIELVDGVPITEWCRQRHSDLQTRLRLFLAVCDAVAHAHRSLVVHRDIKPGNVLVTEEGNVKLLDFGVAKLLSAAQDATRSAPMTPAYSAPEQLSGGVITTATDVYALGILLFELLCGELPWDSSDMPFATAVRRILFETVPTLSRRAQQNARAPLPAQLLRGDLDAIIDKALRKEPAHRYATVNALREDVARVLRHEPVAAREGARLYVIRRFVRRQRMLVVSAAIVLLVIVAGLIGVAWQARVALQQAQRAELEGRKATAVKDFLLDIFRQGSVQNPGGSAARKVTAEQLLDIGATRIRAQLRDQPEVREELLDTLAELNNDLGRTDLAETLAADNLAELQQRTGKRPSEAAARLHLRLATTMVDRYEAAQATAHLRSVLENLRALGKLDSVEAAAAYYELARVAYDGTQADKALGEKDLRIALDILQRRAPTDPLQGDVLQYLARYAKLDEQWDRAERWLNQLLTFETSQGVERNAFAIGNAYLVLGDFQALTRRFEEAERNLRRAVELLSQAAGAEHPSTADARARLGEMLFNVGHREDAALLLNEALRAQMKTAMGVDDATETRKTLGVLEFTRGRWWLAEQLLRQNLQQMRNDPDKELRYAVSAANLATVLGEQGQLAEARALYELSLDVYGRFIGRKSAAYAQDLDRGGLLALAEGKFEEAASLFEQVLAGWPPPQGELPSEYVRAVLGLAAVDLERERIEPARVRVDALLRAILASQRPSELVEQEAQARRLLGDALRRAGQTSEAEPQLRRAVQLREALDDRDSPWLARARLNLAECLIANHKAMEARRLIALAAEAESRQRSLNASYRREVQRARSMLERPRVAKTS
jgi:eukaryotic-like serine/threonine-protein kinase